MSQVVFVLEDDADIRRLVQYQLEGAGYVVRAYPAVGAIVQDAERQRPALFLLDIMVPGGDGLDLCRRLRLNPTLASVPIIFLTARAGENDRVHGLELGADDYITKPFSGNELVARIQSFLRRKERSRKSDTDGKLQIGDATLVRDFHTLENQSKSVTLTALEFRLLWFLGEAEGKLLTRAQILERVWNDVSGVPTRVVDVHVAALRKKLNEVEANLQISSVRGIGYRLDSN